MILLAVSQFGFLLAFRSSKLALPRHTLLSSDSAHQCDNSMLSWIKTSPLRASPAVGLNISVFRTLGIFSLVARFYSIY